VFSETACISSCYLMSTAACSLVKCRINGVVGHKLSRTFTLTRLIPTRVLCGAFCFLTKNHVSFFSAEKYIIMFAGFTADAEIMSGSES